MIPTNITADVQLLEQDAIVELFEIDATGFDGGGLIRFTSSPLNGQPVMFGGQQYIAFPIQADGFQWSGNGPLPRPTLTAAALDVAFISLVMQSGDLVGAPVKRIRTYRKHLDDGSDPDPDKTFPIDYYVIERKTSQTRSMVQFELSVQMDQEGRMIPSRQIIRDSCSHRYRWWDGEQYQYTGVTCPYVGAAEYTTSGIIASTGQDRCGKRLSDCKIRFGKYAELPFYGFPGVSRYR